MTKKPAEPATPPDLRDVAHLYDLPDFTSSVARWREVGDVVSAACRAPDELRAQAEAKRQKAAGAFFAGGSRAALAEAAEFARQADEAERLIPHVELDGEFALDALRLQRDLVAEEVVSPRVSGELRRLTADDVAALQNLEVELERRLAGLLKTVTAAQRLLAPRWRAGIPTEFDDSDVDSIMRPLRKVLAFVGRAIQQPLPAPAAVTVRLRILRDCRESEDGLEAQRGDRVTVEAAVAIRLIEGHKARPGTRDRDYPEEFPEPRGPTAAEVGALAQVKANAAAREVFAGLEADRRLDAEIAFAHSGRHLRTEHQP